MKGHRREGFIFLDLLIAIFIASAAMVFVFTNVSQTAKAAGNIEDRITDILTKRTEYAQGRETFFVSELPE